MCNQFYGIESSSNVALSFTRNTSIKAHTKESQFLALWQLNNVNLVLKLLPLLFLYLPDTHGRCCHIVTMLHSTIAPTPTIHHKYTDKIVNTLALLGLP